MKKRTEILIHVIFWALYMANSAISYPSEYIDKYGFWNIAFKQFLRFLVILYIFYVNYSFLIPKKLTKKKYAFFSACEILVVLTSLCLYYLRALLLDIYFDAGDFFYKDLVGDIPYVVTDIIFFIIISAGAKFSVDWFRDLKIRDELEKEKAVSALAMLKYQISPHFLYNTLHNINYLVKADAGLASESIIKLSEIMRYMFRETDNGKVDLLNEIYYLRSFIELQKIRMANPGLIKFEVEGDAANIKISPLLFISFIENAFKHGDLSGAGAYFNFKMKVSGKLVIFTAENKIGSGNKDSAKGVGVANVKKRLELLYPNKNKLEIKKSDSEFKVLLEILADDD